MSSIRMSGTLEFEVRGQQRTATATLEATRLSSKTWTCTLNVEYEGTVQTATFTVPADRETQTQKLQTGILAAVKSWSTEPWPSLKEVRIALDLER